MSKTWMIQWGRYGANYLGKLLISLLIIISLPANQIVYKQDGTQRNQNNLVGHGVEFKLNEDVISKFSRGLIILSVMKRTQM